MYLYVYWAPPQERSRLTLLAYVGSYLGIFINYTLCGYIAQNWGYEAVFFSTGKQVVRHSNDLLSPLSMNRALIFRGDGEPAELHLPPSVTIE